MPAEAIEVVVDDAGVPQVRWACCKDEGIRITDVLNVAQARDTDDERHLCPLQLGVIKRAVKLWSAPGDSVFSPFAGIGSEGYVAIQQGRSFVGIELKRSYWESAGRNLDAALRERIRPNFLGMFDEQPATLDKAGQVA
jgi:DNA modification methylase